MRHIGCGLGVGSRSERAGPILVALLQIATEHHLPRKFTSRAFFGLLLRTSRFKREGGKSLVNICVYHVMMRQSTHLLNINHVTDASVHMKTTICENKAKTRDHQVTR